MKLIKPKIPFNVAKDLYLQAFEVHKRRPWEIFDDTELIGVRDAAGCETGYACFMGSGGAMFGIVLYRGAEGFRQYRELVDKGEDPEESDAWALSNCLKLALCPRTDLEPEDLLVIRRLGLTIRGKNAWPEFRSHLPGYFPWFLDEREALFLTAGLRGVCAHYDRVVGQKIVSSIADKQCLVYTPEDDGTGFRCGWEPWPEYREPSLNPVMPDAALIRSLLTSKPERVGPWEAGVFYLPAPIYDRERPYFTRLAIVCDERSGVILKFDTAHPEAAVPELLKDGICSAVGEQKILPPSVFVSDRKVATALAPLGEALGVAISYRKNLPAVRAARQAMTEAMLAGQI